MATPASSVELKFRSPEQALRQGISAYNGGYPELAIPALEFAASKNLFLGYFFLARLYSDSSNAYTDHGKAYMLFQKIAHEHADVDPDHDVRAPYVAEALTELAGYVKNGIADISLAANPKLAAEYLHHAAVFFDNEDAQFELSKMQINGEGVPTDVARGRHWLSVLAQNGHPGAQAFLADLYWRGKFMRKDQVRALTLISVAVKNANGGDRIWIEDIYQSIYCGASEGVRKQATGMVADWDSRYGRKPLLPGRSSLGAINAAAYRTCADGRRVPIDIDYSPIGGSSIEASAPKGPAVDLKGPSVADPVRPGAFMHGSSAGGAQMRPVGATQPRR
ncbi:MAG: sel1 repeat family protein [Filomicrobium sp.]